MTDGAITECCMYRLWSLPVTGYSIYVGEGARYGGSIGKLSYTITDSGTGEPSHKINLSKLIQMGKPQLAKT